MMAYILTWNQIVVDGMHTSSLSAHPYDTQHPESRDGQTLVDIGETIVARADGILLHL
jgi:hypothetical protein